jgi:hypothetical protein
MKDFLEFIGFVVVCSAIASLCLALAIKIIMMVQHRRNNAKLYESRQSANSAKE